MSDGEILLEAGTNEIEVLELILGDQSYGINVLKSRFIMEYDPSAVTEVPDSFHSVLGTIWFQNESIPVVDLKVHLGKSGEVAANRIIIVCEFNKLVTGFLVDNVKEIHRISWEHIKPPSPIVTGHETKVTGMAVIDNKEMVMLDFEGIIGDIIGDLTLLMGSGTRQDHDKPELAAHRGDIKMMIADDSRVIRQEIQHKLAEANYTNIIEFDNGKALYDSILQLSEQAFNEGKDITEYLIIIITDIEMPGMDGLTLCKKVKERFPQIKVLVLSSLISKEMSFKCEAVHADGYLSKKDLAQLITRLDEMCL